jgi:uncharacterized protein involved in high-affinity Fe2+ transport
VNKDTDGHLAADYQARKAEYEAYEKTDHPEYLKICEWIEKKR